MEESILKTNIDARKKLEKANKHRDAVLNVWLKINLERDSKEKGERIMRMKR